MFSVSKNFSSQPIVVFYIFVFLVLGFFSPHTTKQLIQFWHYLEIESDPVSSRAQFYKTAPCSAQLQLSILNTGSHLCVWRTGDRFEVPTTPLLGSVNLLECLTEIRKAFYLVDDQINLKGHDSGTARCQRCIRQSMWERERHFLDF